MNFEGQLSIGSYNHYFSDHLSNTQQEEVSMFDTSWFIGSSLAVVFILYVNWKLLKMHVRARYPLVWQDIVSKNKKNKDQFDLALRQSVKHGYLRRSGNRKVERHMMFERFLVAFYLLAISLVVIIDLICLNFNP